MSNQKKMLSEDHELMAEWDYGKNCEIDPKSLSRNSTVKVWWKCNLCGFSWISSPHNRRRPHCASCNRKVFLKKRIKTAINRDGSLLDRFAELILEWDYKKNDLIGLHPEELTAKSNKKANWICKECGYEWVANIAHRTAGTGCPCCAGKVVVKGINDLATINPELALEWNPRNQKTPSKITIRSGENVWWKCNICGYEWQSTVSNRTAGNNCPSCKGMNTSFAEQSVYYYLSKVFNYTINRYIEPLSKMEIDIFVKEVNIGIEYDGYRYHNNEEKRMLDDKKTETLRSIGINLIRVRETSRDAQPKHLPQLQVAPDVSIEYYPKPRYKSMNALIYNLLNSIHEITDIDIPEVDVDCNKDRFKILHNMYQGRTDNSLNSLYPDVAQLWDMQKNDPLKPNEVTSKSGLRVFWKCPECDYKWETTISSQINSHGCPQCNNFIVSDKYNFALLYPELLKEWDYTRNDVLPENVMPFSHDKRNWVCETCGHRWYTSTAHRINGTGCPECSKEISRLAVLKPVSQYSKDRTKLIAQYESARAAERATNIGYKQISACCSGNKPSAGGFWWCFAQ